MIVVFNKVVYAFIRWKKLQVSELVECSKLTAHTDLPAGATVQSV